MTFKIKGTESHTKIAHRGEKGRAPSAWRKSPFRAWVAEERPARERQKGRPEGADGEGMESHSVPDGE